MLSVNVDCLILNVTTHSSPAKEESANNMMIAKIFFILPFTPDRVVIEMGHGNDAFLHRLAAQSAFEIDLNCLLTLFGIVFSHVGLLLVDYMTKYT